MKGVTQVFLRGVAIFYERCGWFLLRLCGSVCIELVTGAIQHACQSELTHHPFLYFSIIYLKCCLCVQHWEHQN